MRDVLTEDDDCGIGTAVQSPKSWAAFVTLMNKPEKKQDLVLQNRRADNASALSDDLVIPTPAMCNEVSYEEEKKKYQNEGMRRTKEASRRLRSSQRPKE